MFAFFEQQEAVAEKQKAVEAQDKAVAAQRRTVKEMIEASWKGATFFADDSSRSYEATRSWIFGLRALYDHLRLFMDLGKLQSLSPVPVFVSGPHLTAVAEPSKAAAVRDFDFRSYQFGHYNPEFIRWAYDNAIPASENEALRLLTQPFYDKFLREMSRYYYIVHLDVQAALPRMTNEVIPRFLQDLETFRDKPFEDKMGAGPGAYLQYQVFSKYADQFGSYDSVKGRSVSIFEWSSGKLDVYYPNVAGAFWIRRMVDGTSDGFADVLRKLLTTYDREWLATAPEAQPHTKAGAKRFAITF